jgi:hypothetical protein
MNGELMVALYIRDRICCACDAGLPALVCATLLAVAQPVPADLATLEALFTHLRARRPGARSAAPTDRLYCTADCNQTEGTNDAA